MNGYNRKTLVIMTLMLYATLAALIFMWRGTEARRATEQAYKETEAVFDERLPDIVPRRYEETKERTVKDREAVHEEAKALSHDALGDALNSELMHFDPGICIGE